MSRKVDDWINSYLEYTENSEPPKNYKKWVAISVIASVLQRKVYIKWGDITFYPNLYIVLVGPAGRCRKGTAMGVGHRFLRDIGISLAAEATTREALIKSLEESATFQVSPEGNMSDHSSLTIFSPELTVFLGYNNLALLSDLTDWYDCREEWQYRTKTSGTNTIKGVYVNLIGATTPDLIRTALPQDAVGGGLSSRIIFVAEQNKGKIVALPFLTNDDLELYEDLRHDLDAIYSMEGEFRFTKEFTELWVKWYEDANINPPFKELPVFEGYVNRRSNHIMKLCMVISASEGSSMIITAKHLARAIDFLEDIEVNMPMAFVGHGASPNSAITARIRQTIKAMGDRGIHKTQLFRTYIDEFETQNSFSDILNKLIQGKFIRFDPETDMFFTLEADSDPT